MSVKATVSKKKRRKGSIAVWVIGILCVLAIALTVYSIVFENIFFAVCYLIGIVLGVLFIIVRLNELYSTWIEFNDDSILLRCWDNCFFPYQTLFENKFFGELLPAKCVRLRVPISEISKIYVGTKTFIKRNTDNEAFLEAVALYEKTKYNANQRLLEKAEILYIETEDNDSVFMNISGFEPKTFTKILSYVERKKPEIEFRINSKDFKKELH